VVTHESTNDCLYQNSRDHIDGYLDALRQVIFQ